MTFDATVACWAAGIGARIGVLARELFGMAAEPTRATTANRPTLDGLDRSRRIVDRVGVTLEAIWMGALLGCSRYAG